MFHSRLGRKIRNAIAPPAQNHGERSHRRSRVSTSPTTMPKPKISIECLFSSPTPATTPNHSQSFAFPVRMIRMTRYAQPIQNSGSKAFIERKWSSARTPGASTKHNAARPWAKPLTAQFAGDHARKHYGARAGQGGGKPDGRQRIAEHRPRDPCDCRDQRWLIDIAPVEMPGAREVVKFIDEVAIAPSGIQVQREFGRGDERHRQPGAYEPRLASFFGLDTVHSFIVCSWSSAGPHDSHRSHGAIRKSFGLDLPLQSRIREDALSESFLVPELEFANEPYRSTNAFHEAATELSGL